MTAINTASNQITERPASAMALQGDAWAAWNASYHADDKVAYRILSRFLYEEATRARIDALFARSDEQNARLDARLHCSNG
ncbi:MAG: hypothetical protein JOZ41_22030 [Chloroflexi bacterium]|nr:hypothetical protein [Chloroflexota bacterium]